MSFKSLECLPMGICSWDYRIAGRGGESAQIKLASFREEGAIIINGEHFSVRKPSMFLGEWKLRRGGKQIFAAKKASTFTRRIKIRGGLESFELTGASLMNRDMELHGAGVSCTMIPRHPLTRRATISGRWDDFRLVAFGFWLTAMTWRRLASNH